jgi:hypothetical protein
MLWVVLTFRLLAQTHLLQVQEGTLDGLGCVTRKREDRLVLPIDCHYEASVVLVWQFWRR